MTNQDNEGSVNEPDQVWDRVRPCFFVPPQMLSLLSSNPEGDGIQSFGINAGSYDQESVRTAELAFHTTKTPNADSFRFVASQEHSPQGKSGAAFQRCGWHVSKNLRPPI